LMRVAPRSDVAVLLTCFGLTIVFDMVVSVAVGVVLAALLFMRRMAEVTGVTLVGSGHPDLDAPLPRGVLLYEIAGPLFFGAAQPAGDDLDRLHDARARTIHVGVAVEQQDARRQREQRVGESRRLALRARQIESARRHDHGIGPQRSDRVPRRIDRWHAGLRA